MISSFEQTVFKLIALSVFPVTVALTLLIGRGRSVAVKILAGTVIFSSILVFSALLVYSSVRYAQKPVYAIGDNSMALRAAYVNSQSPSDVQSYALWDNVGVDPQQQPLTTTEAFRRQFHSKRALAAAAILLVIAATSLLSA